VVSGGSSFRLRSDRRLVVPRFPATRTSVKPNAYEADGKCGVVVRQEGTDILSLGKRARVPIDPGAIALDGLSRTVIPMSLRKRERGKRSKEGRRSTDTGSAQLNKQFSEVVHT
jgi:hypothetical protein